MAIKIQLISTFLPKNNPQSQNFSPASIKPINLEDAFEATFNQPPASLLPLSDDRKTLIPGKIWNQKSRMYLNCPPRVTSELQEKSSERVVHRRSASLEYILENEIHSRPNWERRPQLFEAKEIPIDHKILRAVKKRTRDAFRQTMHKNKGSHGNIIVSS